MKEWSESALWEKSRLFMQRALEEDREGPLFPFWAALSLELLARSTLAKVHPALLADPREPDNILAVFGYRTSDRPAVSIPAKALFYRCSVVVPDFTAEDAKFCLRIASLRNEELHSGTPVFADYPTGQWLGEYYRVCLLLLAYLERGLNDFLGDAGETKAAESLVSATRAKIEKIVKDSIAAKRRSFEELEETERSERIALANTKKPPNYGRKASCPSCDADAILTGEVVSISGPRALEDGVERDAVILPLKLECQACGLELQGLPQLYAASHDLAGQYKQTSFEYPEDFYGIEIAQSSDYEYEYENE